MFAASGRGEADDGVQVEGGATEEDKDGEETATGRGLPQETGQSSQGERSPDRPTD